MVTLSFLVWSLIALQLGPIAATISMLALLLGIVLGRRLG